MDLKKMSISHVSVDICTKCQLRCISCSTSKGIIRNGFVKEGIMSFLSFKHIIDENPQIEEIELSNWGEIFLNKEIIPMLEYAATHEVRLVCGNGANFNNVTDTVLEALVKYKLYYLNLSIDGACNETYSIYRRNGDFEKVISNIRKLNTYKAKYDSAFPKLSWQFIIFGHNEHEINTVKELCKELNMVFNPKMNHSDFSPVKNLKKIKKETGLDYASRDEYLTKHKDEYKHPCYQCLYSPQINWNGDVLGCCVNKWKGLGNILDHPLVKIFNFELYKKMLETLVGKRDVDDTIPCYYCPNFEIVKNNPLNEDGLKKYSNYVPAALR